MPTQKREARAAPKGAKHTTQGIIGTWFEHSPLARCLLSDDGKVLAANASARKMLTAKNGLSYRHNGIYLSDEVARAELLRALRRRRSSIVLLKRADQEPPIVAMVECPSSAPVHCMIFWTPGIARVARFASIARRYELSPQQARVAAELVAGRSLERIARKLGVTVATVRSHLKVVYAKLQVGSQSGVIALLVQYLL